MPNFPNFPIPSETPEQTRCICIEIPDNNDWLQVFTGLLAIPSYWFNWQRDNLRSGKELAQHWTKLYDNIDWSNMSCCCDTIPVQYRYTESGVMEKSIDGGVTWLPSPEDDSRNNSTRYPPLTGADGDDKKCLAAESMVMLIKEQVGDQLTDDMSRYTLDQLVKDWVGTMIETSNPFEALIRVITNQIFALVISALRSALTTEVYDQLKCILYCGMNDDASFDNAAWEAAREEVLSQITGIPGVFLEHLLFLLGVVGTTNLARSGAATSSDCSACDCGYPAVYYAEGAAVNIVLPDEGTDNVYTIEAWNGGSGVWYWYQFFQNIVTSPTPPWLGGKYTSIELLSGSYANRGTYNKDTGVTTAGHWPSPDECPGGIYAEGNEPFTIRIIVDKCP